jgi:hypothetical protein
VPVGGTVVGVVVGAVGLVTVGEGVVEEPLGRGTVVPGKLPVEALLGSNIPGLAAIQ